MDDTNLQEEDAGLINSFWRNVIIWTVVIIVLLNLLRIYAKKAIFGDPYYSITEYKNDTVYLFTFPRKFTRQLLNLSPYAVKLETWLRLKKIKYEVSEDLVIVTDSGP